MTVVEVLQLGDAVAPLALTVFIIISIIFVLPSWSVRLTTVVVFCGLLFVPEEARGTLTSVLLFGAWGVAMNMLVGMILRLRLTVPAFGGPTQRARAITRQAMLAGLAYTGFVLGVSVILMMFMI